MVFRQYFPTQTYLCDAPVFCAACEQCVVACAQVAGAGVSEYGVDVCNASLDVPFIVKFKGCFELVFPLLHLEDVR